MPKKNETPEERAVRELLGISSDEESGDETGGPGPTQPPVDPNLVQCLGACGNKHPKENIARCEAGHEFCFEDARAYTTAQLGKGVPVLNCIKPDCGKIFPGVEVLKFIDLNIFNGFTKDRLKVMIERVGVTDLVEICPNCNTVNNCGPRGPGNENYVCRKTDCKRDTCRKCKRLSHSTIPDCDEAIKSSFECGHCIPDYPPAKIHPASNIVRCQDGHPFCIESAQAYLTSQLGKGIPVINCLHPGCDKIFPGTEVLRFIDLDVFKGLPKATLEKMIIAVGVVGLVEICPNCNTVNNTGPLTDDNPTFTCRNTDCKQTICRKCRRLGHGTVDCTVAAQTSTQCTHCNKVYPNPDDIIRCERGHPYCFDAARDSLTSQIGTGITSLKCLEPNCDSIFPGKEVLRFIDLRIFVGWARDRLEKLIAAAGVKGLVELCPNCDTPIICGPIDETAVLQCRNDQCGKSFCRKCNKGAHGTLTCEQNEIVQNGGSINVGGGGTSSGGQGGVGSNGNASSGGGAAGSGKDTADDPNCECEGKTRISLEAFISESMVTYLGNRFAESLLTAALSTIKFD